MTMIAVRLDDEIAARLDRLAVATHRTKTFYVREAILEHMDDLEAAYSADRVLEQIRTGKMKTYTSKEARKMLGL